MFDTLAFSSICNDCINWMPQAAWYLIACATILPLEFAFGSAKKDAWHGRFGNLCAMLIHFAVGGVVLGLVLATPAGQWLASYPQEPRLELLRNPYVWALTSAFLVERHSTATTACNTPFQFFGASTNCITPTRR